MPNRKKGCYISDTIEVLEFKIIPINERWYSDESTWGIFSFITQDNIPHYKYYDDPEDEANIEQKKMSTLIGKMQRLYIGTEYKVQATCTYNAKYSSYEYNPLLVSAIAPKTIESQSVFLKAIISKNVANNLLNEYPCIVEQVINGELNEIEYDKVKGIGKKSWNRIKNKIIDNYIISDIITILQPIGVSYSMIKRMLSDEPNPELLKQKILDNPYIMTKVRGLGFKKVDDFSLKLKPELKVSMQRLTSFIKYYLRSTGENSGHTWVHRNILNSQIINNIPECAGLFPNLMSSNDFLYESDGRIGLSQYYEIEQNIYDILLGIEKFENKPVLYSEEYINTIISKVEMEQGFCYKAEQIKTIKSIVNSKVSFLFGEAGTGKTSIIRCVLRIYSNSKKSVTACALSAKAAQRITEATGYQAATIHKTLGAKGIDTFEYNRENPLNTDVLLLDESSMVNAMLLYQLLCAVGENTVIIFAGDRGQLSPIGFGNPFSDLIDKAVFNSKELTEAMRQAALSGILSDARSIRRGVNPVTSPDLKIIHGELEDMYYMFRNNRESLQNIAIKTYMNSIKTNKMDDVIIVVPRKVDCINCSVEINKIIQAKLFNTSDESIKKGYKLFYLGEKVMQISNNYDKSVFNGETGYITSIYKKDSNENFCEIKFNDRVLEYSEQELDQLELAYALTLHKVQGSEYKIVIGIIDMTHSLLLDRCMLYTLITRAKERFALLAEPKAFLQCMKNDNNSKIQTWLKYEIGVEQPLRIS